MKNQFIIGAIALIAIAIGWFAFPSWFGESEPQPSATPIAGPAGLSLGFLNHPSNISVAVFADGLTNARVIAFDPAGRMLVSETKAGRVTVLEDADKDGKTDKKSILIDSLRSPHGLAFYSTGGTTYIYIAETHQVVRFVYDVKTGQLANRNGKNIANLPADGRHFTRTIGFGPNFRKGQIVGGLSNVNTQTKDKLYMSVGSSCDVCLEDTWKRAAILESDPDGTFTAEFAGGLRNSVFFDFHPETKEIWATEMGRDNLGDNLPPDEVNIVRVAGPEHKYGARRYGWPFCYGDKTKDTKFNPEKVQRIDLPTDCSQTESPVIQIPAHSAPLGITFVTGQNWPTEWRNDLLVAYHGSWNRSEPTGYKIVKFDVDKEGKVSGTQDLITGWLGAEGKVNGRPVDLKFGPDGALYISDDASGVIYRVTSK